MFAICLFFFFYWGKMKTVYQEMVGTNCSGYGGENVKVTVKVVWSLQGSQLERPDLTQLSLTSPHVFLLLYIYINCFILRHPWQEGKYSNTTDFKISIELWNTSYTDKHFLKLNHFYLWTVIFKFSIILNFLCQ